MNETCHLKNCNKLNTLENIVNHDVNALAQDESDPDSTYDTDSKMD